MLQFLHPLLLLGTLAFAVPLIIHLLNRQRFKKRRWAAMEFLLQAYRKQRRRLRTENLILLLLRCLIPILLAVAIARPILRRSAGLGGLGGSAHHILVIDSSYSMGHRPAGGSSAFDRARALAAELLDRLEGVQGQRVSLIIAGQFPRRILREVTNLSRAKASLMLVLRPEDGAGDLSAALAMVREMVEEPGEADDIVYMFTDLQTRSVGEEALRSLEEARPMAAEPGPAGGEGSPDRERTNQDTLRDALDGIVAAGGEVVVIDTGPAGAGGGREDNTQITDLRLRQPAAIARVASGVLVSLRNTGNRARTVQVTLELDGGEPMRRETRLEGGAEGEVEFEVVFRDTGPRRLQASLQGDRLEADDSRYLVVGVRDRLQVLMVDGAPPDEDEVLRDSHALRLFLDPTAGDGSPEETLFHPTVVEPLALLSGQVDPSKFDLTVLANVERLNTTAVQGLDRALSAGKGLLAMLGDRVDPDNWNATLHGAGIQPMRLLSPTGVEPGSSNPYRPEVLHPEHPVFADLQDTYLEIFQSIPIYRCMGTSAGSLAEDAVVLARVSDPEGSPLLVLTQRGEGRAAFLTSPISHRPDRWNRLESPYVAFAFLYPLTFWLTLPANDPFNVTVGSALSCSLPYRPTQVTIERPERSGQGRAPVGEDSRALPGGRFSLPSWSGTRYAGFYTFDMQLEREAGAEAATQPFAVNVDPQEGELTYLSHEQVRELGFKRVRRSLPDEGSDLADSGSSDLGPGFLYLLLAFLLGEAAWARLISGRRS